MIPGGLLALVSLAMMIWVSNLTWWEHSLSGSQGLLYMLLLAPVYAGSVFLSVTATSCMTFPRRCD